jgi:hypothetical protein
MWMNIEEPELVQFPQYSERYAVDDPIGMEQDKVQRLIYDTLKSPTDHSYSQSEHPKMEYSFQSVALI